MLTTGQYRRNISCCLSINLYKLKCGNSAMKTVLIPEGYINLLIFRRLLTTWVGGENCFEKSWKLIKILNKKPFWGIMRDHLEKSWEILWKKSLEILWKNKDEKLVWEIIRIHIEILNEKSFRDFMRNNNGNFENSWKLIEKLKEKPFLEVMRNQFSEPGEKSLRQIMRNLLGLRPESQLKLKLISEVKLNYLVC